MKGWIDDLQSAYRSLRRRPGLTLAALLTLTVGIGANTVIFTVVEGVLIHPLPYRDAEQLVYFEVGYRRGERLMTTNPSLALLEAWRLAPSLTCLEAYEHLNVRLSQIDENPEVNSVRVSPGLLSCLGVEPLLGRGFAAEEGGPGAAPVVLLGHRLWRNRFGAEPGVVGESVEIAGKLHTIGGVLPAHARFVDPESEVDLWLPLDVRPEDPKHTYANGIARLAEGATVEAARAETRTLSAPFDEEVEADLVPVVETPRDKARHLEDILLLLQLAVGSILLIACVNVAQLLLAQGESRSREMALRAVLGAGRSRLLRQLMTESCVLALLGGAGGLLSALWGLESLLRLLPEDLAHLKRLTLNPTVVAFTLALALLTGVLFGLLPAFQGFMKNLSAALREGSLQAGSGRRRRLLRHGLVATQVTLALVLLTGAGWLIRSQVRLGNADPGFDTEDLYVARLSFAKGTSADDEVRATTRTILEGLRAAGPIFEDVTLADRLPPGASRINMGELEVEGRTPPPEGSSVMSPEVAVAPGFFRDAGIPMIEGDEPTAGFVAVNENLARSLWPGQSAVGKRFRFAPEGDWLRISGVVGNVRRWGLHEIEDAAVYTSFDERPNRSVELAVRSSAAPDVLFPELKARLEALAPGVEIRRIAGARERLLATIGAERFNTLVMSLFAMIAALLTAVGIYGVVAYAVSRETREIGIRMALGARGRQVLWLHFRRILRPVAGGSVLGLGGAIAGARLLEQHLHGVEAGSFEVLAAVLLLVSGVSLIATWIPARRAARIDPAISLRCE